MEVNTIRVLFLHGLESGINGSKVTSMRNYGYNVHCPSLNTKDLREFLKSNDAPAQGISRDLYKDARESAIKAIKEFDPHILVGSSFGGGLAASLINEGIWIDRPAVLLAPAAKKLFGITHLSHQNTSGLVTLLHGRNDKVVPLEHSTELVLSSMTVGSIQWLEDGHRLKNSHKAINEAIKDTWQAALDLAV